MLQKLRSLIACNPSHFAYPLPTKHAPRIFQKVCLLKPKDKICMHLADKSLGGFGDFSEKLKLFNASWLTFRRFVEPVERTYR